jgi:hypothetical protein
LKDEINNFAADKRKKEERRQMHRFRENPCIEIIDRSGRVPGWGTASVNAES